MINNDIIKILVVDDDEGDFFIFKDYLSELVNEYEVEWCETYNLGAEKIKEDVHDIYFVDYRLGAENGIELLRAAVASGNTKPFVLLTGMGNREVDIEAMRAGAADYVAKENLSAERIDRIIRFSLKNYIQNQLIQQQQQQYQGLFEQSIDPIYITNKELLIVDVNTSLIDLFNCDYETLLRMSLKDLFANEKDFLAFNEQTIKEGYVKNFTTSMKCNNELNIECIISSAPVTSLDGEVNGYQGIIHDISDLKKAEDEMRLAEKLSLTGRMARTIAHEVRNPLTNINLALEQLTDELPESIKENSGIYTDMISRNTERINTLINNLLKSAKPGELSLKEGNINELLDSAIDFCRDRLKLRNVKLEKGYDCEIPSFQFDNEKMQVAFVNLITNAIEAMEETESPTLKIKTESVNGSCSVIIEDNGKGMNKETKNSLFDAFFTGRRGGMGLGMTAVQSIITGHKGEIEVESEEGKGTIFIIKFKFY